VGGTIKAHDTNGRKRVHFYENVSLNSALVVMMAGAAFAQTSGVGKRAENQQDRIAQGVKAGTLSA
jgi:hypothetical protein